MSNKEIFNYLRNSKINDKKLEEICYFFAKDYTASKTAEELKISRQTVNNYYKMIRFLLLKNQNEIYSYIKENRLCQNNFSIKYAKIANRIVYFIECDDKVHFINEDSNFLPNINSFVKEQLENSLINNRKANSARVLFIEKESRYLVTKLFKSQSIVSEFINNRLKKFRGVNNDNFHLHLNETQFKFNNSVQEVYNTLLQILNLNTKRSTI